MTQSLLPATVVGFLKSREMRTIGPAYCPRGFAARERGRAVSRSPSRLLPAWGLVACVIMACAAPQPGPIAPSNSGEQAGALAPGPAQPKGTLRIAWGAEPPTLAPKFMYPGSTALNELA